MLSHRLAAHCHINTCLAQLFDYRQAGIGYAVFFLVMRIVQRYRRRLTGSHRDKVQVFQRNPGVDVQIDGTGDILETGIGLIGLGGGLGQPEHNLVGRLGLGLISRLGKTVDFPGTGNGWGLPEAVGGGVAGRGRRQGQHGGEQGANHGQLWWLGKAAFRRTDAKPMKVTNP